MAGIVGKVIPVPVRVANDADCAALGEHIAGAGTHCENIVMLTLGSGVGGGILLNGRIFEGSGLGGSELGHMVIVRNGRRCTCGRRGCLEAYVSLPALQEEAMAVCGRELAPAVIFDSTDDELHTVSENYIASLGAGIVNMINLFRPQMILLGGLLSEQVKNLIPSLERIVRQEAFGGHEGTIPEIAAATLGKDAGVIGAASLV